MDIQVSLASRGDQSLSETAAAVHVLTREDIRRSAATTIAELLRQIPGVHVARIDANKWAISVRGFNDRFANKLLVQVDGRTIYNPAFSGVYWEDLDLVLDDVERIEVIRGPGATLWGANAVNGIINVVTRSAADTQGSLVRLSGGMEDRAIVSARHGGRLGDAAHYRGYLKYTDGDAANDVNGASSGDPWSTLRAGGRLDWSYSQRTDVHVQGEIHAGDLTNQVNLPQLGQPAYMPQEDPIDVRSGHLLGRWEHSSAGDDRWTAQVYYNFYDREEFVEQREETIDLDLQHQFGFGMHQVVWGGGYRRTWDHFRPSLAVRIGEMRRTVDHWSLFLQDDMALHSDRLHLIAGTKVEHNDFTGGEVQPSLRLRWSPNDYQTVWGGVSRAVRTPSRGERDVRVILPNAALPVALLPDDVVVGFAALLGNESLRSEVLLAWETGVRLLPTPWLLFDAIAFVHVYDGLRALVPGTPYRDDTEAAPMTILPASFRNDMDGTGRGLEVSVDGRLSETTRLQVHYSFLDLDLTDPLGTSAALEEDNIAATQWFARASTALTPRLTVDVTARYVSELTAGVEAYAEADVRLGYSVSDDVELELALTNLLANRHQEFLPTSLHSDIAEIERGARLGITWRH